MLSEIQKAFEGAGASIDWADSGKKALSLVEKKTFDMVVADESLVDMTGLEFARKLVMANPMIHCAVISRLSPDDYHKVSEGLGLLMQLPPEPDKEKSKQLVSHLKKIMNL